MVRRVRSLQAGAGVKPNSSHSDLWGEIHTLLANCRDRITICKVVPHGAGEKAQTDIEEWAFWHNALVDHAALKYNETRPPVFWELWTKVATELEHFRKVHHGVLQVILQVGRMGSQLDKVAKQSGNFQVETAPSGGLEGIDDNAPSQIPAAWTFSQKLIKHCTLSNLNVVQRWWLKHGVPHLTFTSGLAWISGPQLYVDFLLEHGAHGPVMVGGKWVPYDVKPLKPHEATTSRRVRMFLTLWKAVLTDNGMVLAVKLNRPSSAVIAFWCQTYRLAWSSSRLAKVDEVLMNLRQRQLVKPQELDEVDLVDFLP